MSGTTLAIAFGPMPLGDALLLRAGLRTAGVSWRTTPRETCDIFFAIDLEDLPPPSRDGPRCVVAGARRASSLPVTFLDRWPNVGQMADAIALSRTPVRGLTAASSESDATVAGTPSSPMERWLDDLAQAETSDRMIHLATRSGPVALLDPRLRCAWLAPSVAGRLAEVLDDGPVTLLGVSRVIPPTTAVRASLVHVLWALALAGRWHLDPLGLPTDRRLRLRRWPDFGSLERRDTFLRVASRLTRQPTSLRMLLANFPKEHDDLLVFLAGCRLCGWLEITADIDDTPPSTTAASPGRMHAAIGALRRALGMKEAIR